ncbi:uncharacterized protein LOC103710695 [Phoenix dactylifera]|uniref:Uncharacterized protein LOC103710695 n=1 Tax=Phoenix dactylifera TaxID=42345 RepID=A0A8B7C9Z0_PHODC|nr:uncharacterized protein LOC103710695 [Phoenix dactylifera]
MEKVGCGQEGAVLKKGKKKQAKDEVDRLKQAEKKRRRLEKALATSAAIRSELEKKKQKKKEEQQRLDEEGAAIAEAVALHVLLGEDKDESCHFVLNNNRRYNPRDYSSNFDLFMGHQNFAKYSVGGLGWATDAYGPEWKWNDWVLGQSPPAAVHARQLQTPYYEDACQRADLSAGHIAAQAVSSLQIAEDPYNEQFAGQGMATVVINRMLGGSNMGNKVRFYR